MFTVLLCFSVFQGMAALSVRMRRTSALITTSVVISGSAQKMSPPRWSVVLYDRTIGASGVVQLFSSYRSCGSLNGFLEQTCESSASNICQKGATLPSSGRNCSKPNSSFERWGKLLGRH